VVGCLPAARIGQSAAAVSWLLAQHYAVGSAVNQSIRQISSVIGVAIIVLLLGHAAVQRSDFDAVYALQIGLALLTAALCAMVDARHRRRWHERRGVPQGRVHGQRHRCHGAVLRPFRPRAAPVTIQTANEVRRLLDKLEGTHWLLLHGRVNPNQPGDLEGMDELQQKWGVSAWKTYTQYGPNGKGYLLYNDVGIRFIRKRALGVKNICIHKGRPFRSRS
jgi:hypothetical protein